MNKKRATIVICMSILATAVSAAGTSHFTKDNNTTETNTNTSEIIENKKELDFNNYKENDPPMAPLEVDNWPMYRHDPAHTGYSTSDVPDTNSTLWEYNTGTSGWDIVTSAAVVDDKIFFCTEYGHKLFCLDVKTGGKLWDVPFSAYTKSAPAIADGKVYFGVSYGVKCLYATNGTEKWSFTTDYHSMKSSPTIVDGKVYVGSGVYNTTTSTWDGIFYCLDADTGDELWNSTVPDGAITTSPAVVDGMVYFGSYNDRLYCLDANTGNYSWNYTTGGNVHSPAVVDGKVYVSSDDKYVYCINATDGEYIWKKFIGHGVSDPAVFNGRIYVGVWRNIYCLNGENGNQIWKKTLPYETYSFNAPVIADGKLFTGSDGAYIYCLDINNNGAVIWNFHADGYVYASPSIANGKVFFGTSYGTLYCFRDNHRPITPNQPIGPTEGGIGIEYTFITNTIEPDDDYLYYLFDWGDGTNSSWVGPYLSNENVSVNHTWVEESNFDIKVKAKDHLGLETNWSLILTINITNRPPETPIAPSGPLSFEIGKICFYETSTDEPDGHKVQYRLDWDDKTYSEWSSLVVPGQTISLSHSWISPGTYMVKAQARDEYNMTTEWSEGLPVVVSADDWWPWWSMFRHDPLNAGSSPSTGPETNNITWTSSIDGNVQSTAPAVVDDKVFITVGGHEDKIYCFNATNGNRLWMNIIDDLGRSPAVVDGRVFLGVGETIYCWDAETGEELWRNTTTGSVHISPVVADGKLYVASWFGEVYCFDVADGTRIWSENVGYGVHFTMSSPSIGDDKLFIGSTEGMNGNVYCFNASNGNVLWTFSAGSDVKSSPAFAYSNIYVGADNGMVYCLDATTGQKKWSFETSKDFYVRSSPAISDGYVYIGSANHKIYCLHAFNGTEKWTYDTGTFVYSSPVIADGKLYIGHLTTTDRNILCLDVTSGDEIWSYSTGEGTWSSPAIANGKLYVGERGKIHCFGSNLPPETPDPPFGPDEGIVGKEYTFCIELPIDPNGEPFSVLWDWGDGNFSGWMGSYNSGETACAPHTWMAVGDYEIKVKIENKYGVQSSWTDPFLIHIVEPAFIELRDIRGGFGLKVFVENTGSATATNVKVNITIEGGLFIYIRNVSYVVEDITAGESIKVPSKIFGIGLGKLTDIPLITVTASADDVEEFTKTVECYILLFLVIIK